MSILICIFRSKNIFGNGYSKIHCPHEKHAVGGTTQWVEFEVERLR
jgi:hypothetical protein